MKFILFFVAAFFTIALLSYTAKTNAIAARLDDEIVRCEPHDILEIAKAEANTKQFAALHADPRVFKAKDLRGKIISFETVDGTNATGYEIRAKKKTKNFLLVIHEWYGLNDYIKQEAALLNAELDNIHVIALIYTMVRLLLLPTAQ